ncbi:MAG: pyrimidine 5'-nucleotidase [Anaerolineae bacterium]
MNPNHRFTTIFFDLDETLYARQTGLMQAIGRRIVCFMTERLGLSPDEAEARRKYYYQTYGTTLRGLQHDFDIETTAYLAFVHDLPLPDFLRPDPALDRMLAGLPQQKIVFTNADAAHAKRVLDALGIRRHFPAIIDIVANEFICKPNIVPYRNALASTGAEARRSILVEDSARNLAPAKSLGMATILVDSAPDETVDVHVATILEVGPAVERLSQQQFAGEDHQ